MSAKLVKKEGYTVDFEITVSPELFEEGMQKSYIKNRNQIMIPGFRKGKAPRKFIEKLYGAEIFYEDAVNEVLQTAYPEAIKELELDPVSRPDIDIKEIGAGKDLVLTVKVDVTPDVTLGDYKGLKLEKVVSEVTDAEVDAEMTRMQERNARMVAVEDRAAEMGDIANIDYLGTVDGVAFDGGKAEGHDLELGSGSFIPGFEEGVVAMNIGDEKDIDVTFPEEYHAEDLKGKAAVFHVKLNKLQKKEIPALDDEFAKDVSEFDTLAELKADIKAKAQERKDAQAKADLENKAVEAVVEGMTVDVPPAMIDERAGSMLQEFDMQLRQQGMSLEMYTQYTGMTIDSMKEHYKTQAEASVKGSLALEAIAKAEKIEATDADVDAELEKMAKGYGMEVEKIKEIMGAQMDAFRQECVTRKTVEFLVEKAKVTEVAEASEKKPAAKKTAAKKTTATKSTSAKKTTAKKAEDGEAKPAAKKTTTKKAAAEGEEKKTTAKKTTAAKSTTAKKTTTAKKAEDGEKKPAAKKTTTKKAAAKKDEE